MGRLSTSPSAKTRSRVRCPKRTRNTACAILALALTLAALSNLENNGSGGGSGVVRRLIQQHFESSALPDGWVLIQPNDPQLLFSDFFQGSITSQQATFNRGSIDSKNLSPTTRLSFSTNATIVDVELEYGSGCSCGCGGCACGEFKLYIDDGATESKFGSSQKVGLVSYTIFTQEQPQWHNFTFSWPFNREVAIKSIRLYPEDSVLGATPPRPDKRTVIYGDSITQGVCASEVGKTYPDQLSQLTRVVNLGKSKQKLTPAHGSIVGGVDADVVLVNIGVNDIKGQEIQGFQITYNQFLTNLRSVNIHVPLVIVSPFWSSSVDGSVGDFKVANYRYAVKNVVQKWQDAGDVNMYYLDGGDMIPGSNDYFKDGLHPNDQGFTTLTNNLIAEGILDLLPINTDPSTFSSASFPTPVDISQELVMEMRCPDSANLDQTIPQVLVDAYEIASDDDALVTTTITETVHVSTIIYNGAFNAVNVKPEISNTGLFPLDLRGLVMSIDLELKLAGAMGESPPFISPDDIVIDCIQANIMGAFKVDQINACSYMAASIRESGTLDVSFEDNSPWICSECTLKNLILGDPMFVVKHKDGLALKYKNVPAFASVPSQVWCESTSPDGIPFQVDLASPAFPAPKMPPSPPPPSLPPPSPPSPPPPLLVAQPPVFDITSKFTLSGPCLPGSGDADSNSLFNIVDIVASIQYVSFSGVEPVGSSFDFSCIEQSGDGNGDGIIDIVDTVGFLSILKAADCFQEFCFYCC